MLKKSLIGAVAAVASLPGRVPAAEAPAGPPARFPDETRDEPAQLGKITVQDDLQEEDSLKASRQTSSSKLDLSLRETPQSVTVITQESLRARQVTDFGQALETSAGVSQYSGPGPFGGQAGFGFNETTIRGIPIDSLNDVREDGFINSTYYALPDMAIYDRIEVIKGPNSVTYGRGSAGGLINRVRKKPLAERRADVELTLGAFDTRRLDVDVTGALVRDHDVFGRLVAAYADEGAFTDGVETSRTVLAPSLDVGLTDTTRLLLEGLYQRDNFKPNPGFPLRGDAEGHFFAPDIPRSLYVGVPNVADDRWNIYSGSAQLDQALSDRWLASLRVSRSRTSSPIRIDRYSYSLSDTGDTSLIRNDFSIDRDIWSGELKIAGELALGGVSVKLATGAELNQNDYHRRGAYAYLGFANIYLRDFAALPDAAVEPGFEYATHDETRGYYLQAQVKPLSRLSVLAGLRYDEADSVYESITGGTTNRKNVSDVSGRVGVTFDVSPRLAVYGVYARSFSPLLFDVDQAGNVLPPETGRIYEAGAKTEWFDSRLGISAAIYRIDRMNMPVAALTATGEAPYSVSAGLQRSQGFEVEVNGEIARGWQISAAYNGLDSQFKDPRDPFFGERPGGSARWQAGLFSTYELQSGPLKGLGFGGSVFSIAERGLSPFEQGSLDGYTRVDLHLFYNGWKSTEVRLSVRNALDERYVEGADRSNAIAQFGSPPAWLLSVRYRSGT